MKCLVLAFVLTVVGVPAVAKATGSGPSPVPGTQPSAYATAPADRDAVYFTPQAFPVLDKPGADVSDALQAAVDQLKATRNFGIVFIPEGSYRISKTIYVPPAVRLIGYGARRPAIVLAAGSPGFDAADPQDKAPGRPMIWFTGGRREPGKPVPDANPGTFYSGISNIDLRIEDRNPAAIALRTHFAQHGIVSHVDIDIGNGKAGIYDVGNEMQDVRFFGGDYGIVTTKPSPGWPFMMLDTYFDGQRRAAIRSREAGLTIVRMQARKVGTVFEVEEGQTERLYLEDARFEDVGGPALVVSGENNAFTQINLRNVVCRNVPVLVRMRESGRKIDAPSSLYRVTSLTHGQQMDGPGARSSVRTTQRIENIAELPALPRSDIPDLPAVARWTDVRALGAFGARGDGTTDDTKALQAAVDRYPVVYLPSGRYRVTDTIRLKPDTVLIGLHPMSTQIVVDDNTDAFSGFGAPKPLLDVPAGGKAVVTGIGLDAGGSNPRAVAAMWRSGAASYMNDVKFIGGHGTMAAPGVHQFPVYNESRTGDGNPKRRWDTQYPSLWVADGGGGIFRNIWSASPYASSGLYVSDTQTPSRVYGLSVEHHVRNEIVLRNVANWRLYDIQTEEEIAESQHAQPLEIVDSHDLTFANLYTFRVIWLNTPYANAIRTWGSRGIEFLNVHNFTQTKYSITNTLKDMASGAEVRPWELARLVIPNAPAARANDAAAARGKRNAIERLAAGFEFADGMCADADGNVFFVDSRLKRIYQWAAARNTMRLVSELHWKPVSLACGSDGKLNVVAEYWPVPGATVDGRPEKIVNAPDADGTSYAFWYHPVAVRVYTIDPRAPDATFQPLQPQASDAITNVGRAFHPANRWRDGGDYLDVTRYKPATSYVLSDGKSVLPVYYDLLRANALLPAVPGKPFFAVDEYMKRVVRFDVTSAGLLSAPRTFAEHGEYNLAVDGGGRVYVPDGDVYVYAPDGKLVEQIATPERPTNVVLAGPDGKTLYFTSRNALYRLRR